MSFVRAMVYPVQVDDNHGLRYPQATGGFDVKDKDYDKKMLLIKKDLKKKRPDIKLEKKNLQFQLSAHHYFKLINIL